MFETGKRDLPREAKIALAPILVYATQSKSKKMSDPGYSDAEKQHYLRELLQENELQRFRLARKTETTQSLYQKNTTILTLTSFLAETAHQRPERFNKLVQTIRNKATQALTNSSPRLLMHYEIKAELLELEKLLLEKYIAQNTPVKATKV